MPTYSKQPSSRAPLVSIIVPAYNAAQYIEESLHSLLNQTWPNLEVIVIDDGSQDDTASIVEGLRQDHSALVLHRQENHGVSTARNRGIELAQGEYIALQDADDISAPDRIAKQLAYLEQHQLALCGCGITIFGRKKKNKLYPEFDSELKPNFLFFGRTIAGPTVMFSRHAVGDIRFNAAIKYGEDLDFIWRVAFHNGNRVGNVQDALYHYRQHDQQATTKLNQTNRDNMISILSAFLQEHGMIATESTIGNLFDLCKQPSRATEMNDNTSAEVIDLIRVLTHFLATCHSNTETINHHVFHCLKTLPSRQRQTPAAKALQQKLSLWQRIKLLSL